MRIHSLLSPKCRVNHSQINGQGVFATDSFIEGEIVAVWGGKIYTSKEVETIATIFPRFETHTVTLAPGFYLGSENLFEFDDTELFNHSCEPNTGVRGQVVLVARRSIAKDEELTFDYDTTEVSAVPFHCKCGASNCRKIIDGNAWRDQNFVKNNYKYISWHIHEMLDKQCGHTAQTDSLNGDRDEQRVGPEAAPPRSDD